MSGDGWDDPDGNSVEGLADPGTTNRTSSFYKPNFRSFGEFMRSAQVRKPVVEISHRIADRAGELSPRRKSGITPPGAALADRFQVNPEAGELKVDGHLRVKVDVFNDARSAAPMEFGNTHVGFPGHRMLGRAGAEFGDFKSGKGKP